MSKVIGVTVGTPIHPSALQQKLNEYNSIPDYWHSELETKADDIQQAMETAGRNKSAFLWYTDAHWPNGNSKVSPKLLDYLYRNTSMNKINFGGDIIGSSLPATREETSGYLHEWRKAIKNLPNHHSVLGNHDVFNSYSYADDNYRYAFMFAAEETPDMVMGDGNYYYIDNASEKTRYLYLTYPVVPNDSSATDALMRAQGRFIVDKLLSTPEGWHIVVIAHRWWQYTRDTNNILTIEGGKFEPYEAELLRVFDAYNARASEHDSRNYVSKQSFAEAKGKVEFCIGGHIHADYNFYSNGGIPVILTTSDASQERTTLEDEDYGSPGTIAEAAVFGIIADYNDAANIKITVVGVGRGTSRIVRKSAVKPTSISNISYSGATTVGTTIDKSKFTFTVNYSDGSTDTVSGASSVSPTTIGAVGNNTIEITYTEGAVTLNGAITIVGTEVQIINLFNKNDADVLDKGRFNSSNSIVSYAAGQLVTGYIEAKVGDKFTIKTDKNAKTNGYTGMAVIYDTNKAYITMGSQKQIANTTTYWTFSDDGLTGEFTILDKFWNTDMSATTYVRFCVAYTDINSISITKA